MKTVSSISVTVILDYIVGHGNNFEAARRREAGKVAGKLHLIRLPSVFYFRPASTASLSYNRQQV